MTTSAVTGPPCELEAVKYTPLPRAALARWRVMLSLATLAACFTVGGLFGVLVPRVLPAVPAWPAWNVAGALACGGLWRWWRMGAVWQRSGYHLADNDLLIRGGLFRRCEVALSYGRIQTVAIASGPLQRRFQLASVTVTTGAFHKVCVHDLALPEAERVRDVLTRLGVERQVAL
ncbi:PH domain-containing protein [Streptomyces sp. Edi2]|uniref:PH domain-containing protein n=1 Tax=Streptomyces sp. Edi2 TaxID=3162528 RepID=UPI003305E938